MSHELATWGVGGQTFPTIPIPVLYVVAIVLFLLAAVKMGKATWHYVVGGILLALFANIAFPKQMEGLGELSGRHNLVPYGYGLIIVVFLFTVGKALTDMARRRRDGSLK